MEPVSKTIRISRPDDEQLDIYLGKKHIASANHDEHGWAAMDLLKSTVESFAKELDLKVVEED